MEFPVRLDDKNYDIKKFLRDHPGGTNTLKNYKGKNILQAMEKFGHSVNAYHMLNDFKVESEKDSNLSGVSENGRIITKEEDSRDKEEIAYLEELEGRLDWSKPLLSQLDAIAPDYEKWVNSAVYRHCRLFSSPLLEALTFTPWYLVPACWLPAILWLATHQYREHVAHDNSEVLSILQFFWHLALGLFLWSIIEYSLHRWVFHLDPGKNLTMIKIHFLIHGLHHKMPFDGLRQVFPPVPALMLACIIYQPVSWFLSYPLIKLTGGLIGYLTYDMIHYYVHHGSPADGTYLYAMKRYHSNHHFVNHDRAFGISSEIWDHVFKTFVKLRTLGFSLRWD
ncbi:fatty acid 2-hydroxylase [Cydia amplana]|uniref:fatty acid 2-hydroxylase n=1 Tax=Cydia amplana TaxID=1869771 RepID=UPI002FE6B2DE